MAGFDLFQSSRNMNEKCLWWARKEGEDAKDSDLIYKRVPDGFFYAVEINAQTQNDNIIAGDFMFEKTVVTLKSNYDLRSLYEKFSIQSECYVKYEDEFWIVTDVQKKKAKMQNSEFGKPDHMSHYWYISLRK